MDSFYILVDKPSGITSFDLIAKLRRIFNERSIGHSGTLDKMASGLMLIAVGKEALKLMEFLIVHDKVYEATMILGVESDTYDISGTIVSGERLAVSGKFKEEEIEEVMKSFVGEIEQVPPKFSALKIDGKRASDRVREGEEIEMKGRKVTIYGIENSELRAQNSEALIKKYSDLEILKTKDYKLQTFSVHCSSGTYIRSLIHDIGQKLGCGALMSDLKRTKIADFDISDAVDLESLEEIEKKEKSLKKKVFGKYKISITEMAEKIFERVDLSEEEFREIKFGRKIPDRFGFQDNLIAAFFEGRLVSILQKDLESLKVYKNFN